jgi:hypothetical protein
LLFGHFACLSADRDVTLSFAHSGEILTLILLYVNTKLRLFSLKKQKSISKAPLMKQKQEKFTTVNEIYPIRILQLYPSYFLYTDFTDDTDFYGF